MTRNELRGSTRLARRARLPALLASLAVTVAIVLPAGAAPLVGSAAPLSVVLTGHGYGHGHGMGQWGALGYAVAHTPYQSILSHYYGGTSLATLSPSAASTQLRVVLTENDGNSVIVTSKSRFAVAGQAVPAGDGALMTYAGSGDRWNVTLGGGCAGPWDGPTVAGVVDPTALPLADPAPGSPTVATDALQLCQSGGNLTLQGSIQATAYNGSPRTVNTLPLEQYVAAVVPSESPSGWGVLGSAGPQGQPWGFQELEAQAVAVRSYAIATLDEFAPIADTCDLTCQSYRGIANESPLADLAAADTVGQVMKFPGGVVAATQYSASTGGYTNPGAAAVGFPAVPDSGDSICIPGACNPNHTWTQSVASSTIEADWPQLGTFEGIEITGRNGYGAWGGRVTALTLAGSNSDVRLTGDQLAASLGLRSNWFIPSNQFVPSGQAPPALVGMAPTADGRGYWLVGTNGGLDTFGDATFYGSMGGLPLAHPIVSMAATPDGKGYWEVASDGGVFAFGDAAFYGSMGGHPLNRPIVGMAATPDGKGYWEVASDGGIFAFGDAAFYGSMGGHPLNRPIVGMAATPDGKGYWEVASDGGIFAFGDAAFYGSTGSLHLNRPVVGMTTSPGGRGYRLVASDGGIFSFGDAPFYGSAGGLVLNRPVVGMAPTPNGAGYWMVASDGRIFSFGDATFYGNPSG